MKKIVTLLVLGIAFPSIAQDPPKPAAVDEVDQKTAEKIEKGLDYLAKMQRNDGSFQSSVPVAAASLAGLSWLAWGDTPDRGKYSSNIQRAMEFIVKSTQRNGYICESRGYSGASGMHGHGYGALFLAEVIGTSDHPEAMTEARDALERAVRLIEKTQNQYGGWNSSPSKDANDDGSGAIAVMQITALRAAREVGMSIDTTTIEKAKKYLLEMTTSEGWYQYNYHMRTGGRSSSALTGAGMYMLGAFELYTNEKYGKGIKNLMNSAPFLKGSIAAGDSGWSSWYMYTAFYSSLAIFQHGGDEWRKWYPAMRDAILKQQQASGAWSDGYGGVYTALALLTLELPFRYLPFFQHGGKGREGS